MAEEARNQAAGIEHTTQSETLVVHMKHDEYDVYIGRNGSYVDHVSRCPMCKRRPLNLCSEGLKLIWYGNPYELGRDGDRAQVLVKFEKYARDRMAKDQSFLNRIRNLYGKVLGCWCKPLPCHGDVYVKLTQEIRANDARYF